MDECETSVAGAEEEKPAARVEKKSHEEKREAEVLDWKSKAGLRCQLISLA